MPSSVVGKLYMVHVPAGSAVWVTATYWRAVLPKAPVAGSTENCKVERNQRDVAGS